MDSRAGSCRWIAASLALLGLVFVAAAAAAAPQLSISPVGYRIENLEPVAGVPRTYDLTARAGVANTGDTATAVTARLDSTSSSITVLDGDLSFGTVGRAPLLRPVISQDTFRLRIVLPKSQSLLTLIKFAQTSLEALSWTISCGNCMHNRPPVANAGAGQTVYVGQRVELDGSASADPDGQPLTFRWSVVSRPQGSSTQLSSPSVIRPTFVADRDGAYVFQLVVNDGATDSAPAAVTITTLNSPPVAQAGPDQTARVGTRIEL